MLNEKGTEAFCASVVTAVGLPPHLPSWGPPSKEGSTKMEAVSLGSSCIGASPPCCPLARPALLCHDHLAQRWRSSRRPQRWSSASAHTVVLFSLGTPSWQPLQNLLQKHPRHLPAVPQALAGVTHFHQGGTHRSAEPGHRLGAQSGVFYAALGAGSAKSLCGEASGLGVGEDKSRALQGQEQSHPAGDTCFGSSDAQAHLPRDDSVLVDPGFEVFILLLENLDLFLQDNVLLCL